MSDLSELSAESLRALRSQVGAVAQERIDELLGITTAKPKRAVQPKIPERLESDIRMEIRAWLELHGAKVYDMEQNRPTRQTPGVSDLIVCWQGRGVFFIEVKRPSNGQSDAQRTFEADVHAAGGNYFVARCIEDVEAVVRTYPRGA